MTRFGWIAMTAVVVCVVAAAAGQPGLCLAAGVALVAVICFGVAFPRLSLFGRFHCRGDRARRAVALTFDDGPDARSTPALLDLLREERVPAAFFCVGQRVEAEPALAARIIREGHLLENHSHAHSPLTNCFGVARLRAELERTQSAIRNATGAAPRFFRPPMGLSNPRVFQAAGALGLKVVGWTARGLDTRSADPERIVSRLERRLEPGAILLLHDGGIPAGRLVVTVKRLLDTLRKHGYEPVRLDTLLP